jgi:hypothetical protein
MYSGRDVMADIAHTLLWDQMYYCLHKVLATAYSFVDLNGKLTAMRLRQVPIARI